MGKLFMGLFLLMFIIAGCATPYQRRGFAGGYSDFQIDSNTFKVQFRGNGYTSSETVEIYALYRCAEVTLEAGYDYFIIVNERGEISRQTTATPGFYTSSYSHGKLSGFYIPGGLIHVNRHRTLVTIKAFHGRKPEGYLAAYDAREMIQYAGRKVKKLPPTSLPPKPPEVRREFAGPKLDAYAVETQPQTYTNEFQKEQGCFVTEQNRYINPGESLCKKGTLLECTNDHGWIFKGYCQTQ